MNTRMRKIAMAIGSIAVIGSMTACGVTTQESTVKIQVGAGPFDDPKVKKCIDSGVKDNSPTNDDYYDYPASERDLDATGQEGADQQPITVVSKDNAEMAIPITLRFNMITDCETLGKFFKAYGQRYNAYLDEDGTATSGWNTMLRKLMYDPMDTTLDEIAKKYNWRDLYNNAAAQNELVTTLKESIGEIVNENAKGEYFENYVVLMKKPVPTNPELVSAIASEQAAVASAASAEAEAKAKEAQARAEAATARAEALKQQAIITGYGSFENYALAQAIEAGLNPFQPTYLVPGTKP